VADQQLELPSRAVQAGLGQLGFLQRRPGHGQGIDRVRLARDPAGLPGLGHQAGRHQHDLLSSGQQIGQQPIGHVPAVLHRPGPLRPVLAGPAISSWWSLVRVPRLVVWVSCRPTGSVVTTVWLAL
jgi:hypothetical protein